MQSSIVEFRVLSEQCTNPKLKQSLLDISSEVQNGVNISEAMRKHLIVLMVYMSV
jgi:hypothetical protein